MAAGGGAARRIHNPDDRGERGGKAMVTAAECNRGGANVWVHQALAEGRNLHWRKPFLALGEHAAGGWQDGT